MENELYQKLENLVADMCGPKADRNQVKQKTRLLWLISKLDFYDDLPLFIDMITDIYKHHNNILPPELPPPPRY